MFKIFTVAVIVSLLWSAAAWAAVIGDQPGLDGTTHTMAYDKNLNTYFKSSSDQWQHIDIDMGNLVSLVSLRRYMSKDGSDIIGTRLNQGESVSYSVDGVTWTELTKDTTHGWENYNNYGARKHAWQTVSYGWSSLLVLNTPVTARYVRFSWDGANGANEALHEIDLNWEMILVSFPSPLSLDCMFFNPFHRGWSSPVSLQAGTGTVVGSPHVAVSANGDAMVVWLESSGSNAYTVYARRYTHTSSFSTVPGSWEASSVVIGTFNHLGLLDSFGLEPRVAMDEGGNAIVVWVNEIDNSTARVHARLFRAGAWDSPQPIDNGPIVTGRQDLYIAASPRVAMNKNGDAIVVWTQEEARVGLTGIYASRFHSGLWRAVMKISDAQDKNKFVSPAIAMNSNGGAIAVWMNQTDLAIGAARFTPTGIWEIGGIGPLGRLFPRPGRAKDVATSVGLATGHAEHIYASWLENPLIPGPMGEGETFGFPSIYVKQLDPSIPLGSATVFAQVEVNLPQFINIPSHAVDKNANVVVVWNKYVSGGDNNGIYARELSGGRTLFPIPSAVPHQLDSRNDDSSRPVVGMDAAGNGIAVWVQSDGTAPSVFASHLAHAAETNTCPNPWVWSQPVLLENLGTVAHKPTVAVYPDGSAIAVWAMGSVNEANSVYAATYR